MAKTLSIRVKVCKTALIAKDGENHADFFFQNSYMQ